MSWTCDKCGLPDQQSPLNDPHPVCECNDTPAKSEPREWWIDPSDELEKDDGCEIEETVYMALREHPRQGPLVWQSNLIHVIEYSAYQKRDHEAKMFCRLYNEALDKIVKLEKECGRDPGDY